MTNFIITYVNLSPKIGKVFVDLENLENKQQLTDSLIKLKKIKSEQQISVNLKDEDTLILCFVDCNDDFFIYSQKFAKKSKSNKVKYKTYFILNDKNCKIEGDSVKSKFYFLDGKLPLKYNKLVYPYSLKVNKGKILSSKFNFSEDE
ncbi:hypothetical protein [Flavobacterium lacisediminis]|uniref:Uncharacterized protein n=1 Tax=Flavobacterium lacisediminis TaxID=2989705 RepID=A0ABT3EHS9_9FLAO|nr:hypothetical protein [Flavobacterium lacisediminis]MCW1148133.1 hypothetical protein [Flavobacterium lacisediminis]